MKLPKDRENCDGIDALVTSAVPAVSNADLLMKIDLRVRIVKIMVRLALPSGLWPGEAQSRD